MQQSALLYQKLQGYHQLQGYLFEGTTGSKVPLHGSISASRIPTGLRAQERLVIKRIGSSISTNTSLWLFDAEGYLSLGHQRFDEPVILCRMRLMDEGLWRSEAPHLCNDDSYRAVLQLHCQHLSLTWQIRGPHKRQTIHLQYS